MKKLYIGVDIGGTNVKIGCMDENKTVIYKTQIKIGQDKTPQAVFGLITAELKQVVEQFADRKLMGIGMGIPGLIDTTDGVVVCSGNLDWWQVDVISLIKPHFDCPVTIANDANVAALGESIFGVAKNYSSVVMLTLGTGVGSGIIIDNKIFAGNKSAGAEIGHMVIVADGRDCTCGGKGCFEAYASATALKEQTRLAMLKNKRSKMWQIGGVENVSGKTAFQFSAVCKTAKKVVDEYVNYLSIGICNVANIFRPQAIILGGGVSHEGERLLNPLKENLQNKIFAGDLGPKVELLLATLRNDAGFMGACALNF